MNNLFLYVLDKAFALKETGLTKPKTPEQLAEVFDLNLGEPAKPENFKDILDGIFENSVNTQNPRFLNQLYGGSTSEAWLGELLVSVLNTSMATYEIAPLATLMEKEIVSALNLKLGFPSVEGLMVPGGSYANMLGIQCARFAKNPDSKAKGLYGEKKYKIFVSSDAHYSSEKALGLMGLGTEALVKVPINENKKMSMESLELAVQACLEQGDEPLCVVSTAGTTVWGAFDPIEEVNKVCEKYSLWHHVDAAWGGLALWSDQADKLFEGLQKVDSITIDFHKLFASTLTKGIFLTSRPEVLKGANSGGGTKYIFHQENGFSYDTGTYALQCGRKVDSLPVWLQWKTGGTKQFANKITELYHLSSWVTDYVQKSADFELLLSPEYMNICFQILPKNTTIEVGGFNRMAREKLMERGNFMVNFASNKENGAFFRLVLSHWGLNQQILEEFFEELENVKKELEA